MTHGTWNMEGNTSPPTNRTSGPNENLIYVIFACDNPVCLMFFFSPHSPASHVRTQVAHWFPLLGGGEK